MTNKWNLEVGDLLLRSNDVGVVTDALETDYGLLYRVYWTWAIDGKSGMTEIHESQLTKAFFTKFKHVKC